MHQFFRALSLAPLLAAALCATAQARGESSYRLPEVRQAVPPATHVVTTPAWSHAADAPGEAGMVAIGGGIVAFASGGQLCGYDAETGARRWCAGHGRNPAYAGGVVAYVGADGALHAVDARGGKPHWTYPEAVRVWPAGDGFFVARSTQRVADLDAGGRVLWSAQLPDNGSVRIVPPYILWWYASSGAHISENEDILRIGAGGGLRGEVGGTIVDVRPPNVLVDIGADRVQEVQDYFLTHDLAVANVTGGALRTTYHYAPDYDANYELMKANCCAGETSGGKVHVEGNDVYVVVHRSIYRYQLGPATMQRPLLVASGVDFIGGPYRGVVYVARNDGLWGLRPQSQDVGAQLVAPSNQAVRGLTIARDAGYAAFADGSIAGFDLASGRPTFAAQPCSRPTAPVRIAATATRIYVACGAGSAWSVTAYPTRI